ncbi:hypothetical protein RIEPE_0028 [Candidatus Riesia pediculicola USDA]|uniref:Uncharacterized protein n=1 Tax=Riesia pediculicola (strain USDA) TaxID=515618 RepID=D4G7K1_RIEPU|nr:hypothetical protein RIEPE_0028 [Candidatus Riesia pediculicola USDA]
MVQNSKKYLKKLIKLIVGPKNNFFRSIDQNLFTIHNSHENEHVNIKNL